MDDKELSNLIETKGYEFLDFGCSAGGSLGRYGKMFGAKGKGLGLDISPEKVKKTREAGFDAVECDLTKLRVEKKVRFIVMSHFLEHIPDANDVEKIINNACRSASEFVFIRQPYFDADPYLFKEGFKFFWSDWHGHPNNMTMLDIHNILSPILSKGTIRRFSLYGLDLVKDSSSPDIHNINSPVDQHGWEAGKHSEKRFVDFSQPVYRETMAIVEIRDRIIEKIEKVFRKNAIKFFDSAGYNAGDREKKI